MTSAISSLRVAFVHNHYRSAQPSGEDTAVALEMNLLRAAGCEVHLYERWSDEIAGFSPAKKALLPTRVVWSREDRGRLRAFLEETRPDVVHVHNSFPLISPAAISVCADYGVPVVATLHNFRTICVNAQLFRDGHGCERCVGHSPWPGVVHRCYRGSVAASAPIAASIAAHRLLGTWSRKVTRFIALSRFARDRFVAGGLPAERIDVLPNFVTRPETEPNGPGSYFLYLGRINFEKGLDLLASAWSKDMGELLVVGDGPTRAEVELAFRQHGDCVKFLGPQPHDRAMEVLAKARALIVPSRVYEGSPVVLAEAYARGVPVIGPRHGAFVEYVEDGETGRLFKPGDPADLAESIRMFQDAEVTTRFRDNAHAAFERAFTPERHRDVLLGIYSRALTDGAVLAERSDSTASVNREPIAQKVFGREDERSKRSSRLRSEVAGARRVLRRDGPAGLVRSARGRVSGTLRRYRRLSKTDMVRGRRAFRVDGRVLELPDDMAWAFADGSYYEKNVEHWFRRALTAVQGPVVYDVGANCGYYSLIASSCADVVYAFEPVSSTHGVLLRNIERNRLSNIEALRMAVGAEEGMRPITLYSSSGNNSIVLPRGAVDHLDVLGFEDVRVRTLDRLLVEGRTRPPDLIKIDTEGGELAVLRGARELLGAHRPLVVLEHNAEIADRVGYTLDSVWAELEPHGYTLVGLSDPFVGDRSDLSLYPVPVEDAPSTIGTVIAVPADGVWHSALSIRA